MSTLSVLGAARQGAFGADEMTPITAQPSDAGVLRRIGTMPTLFGSPSEWPR